jgi:hypothetical protein
MLRRGLAPLLRVGAGLAMVAVCGGLSGCASAYLCECLLEPIDQGASHGSCSGAQVRGAGQSPRQRQRRELSLAAARQPGRSRRGISLPRSLSVRASAAGVHRLPVGVPGVRDDRRSGMRARRRAARGPLHQCPQDPGERGGRSQARRRRDRPVCHRRRAGYALRVERMRSALSAAAIARKIDTGEASASRHGDPCREMSSNVR